MKVVSVGLMLITLFSCRTQVYVVSGSECIISTDTMFFPAEHYHFENDKEPYCVDIESCEFIHSDTIVVDIIKKVRIR